MKRRNIDDVLAAIAAAAAETQGRTLDQIDHAGDAETAAGRKLVSITLEDYSPYPGADPGDACWRYRKELERVLGGAGAVAQALRAWQLSREGSTDQLTSEEQRMAMAWVDATQRARAAGMATLAESHTAWFDVRRVRPAPIVTAARASGPSQPELF